MNAFSLGSKLHTSVGNVTASVAPSILVAGMGKYVVVILRDGHKTYISLPPDGQPKYNEVKF